MNLEKEMEQICNMNIKPPPLVYEERGMRGEKVALFRQEASHVLRMVLQTADELCDWVSLIADLIHGVKQRELVN